MLEEDSIETAVVKWKVQRARGLKRYLPTLSRAFGQIARGVHEWLAEIDARYAAAVRCRQKARRPADARADIQNRHVSGDPSQLGKIDRRGQPAGMELIEGIQLLV